MHACLTSTVHLLAPQVACCFQRGSVFSPMHGTRTRTWSPLRALVPSPPLHVHLKCRTCFLLVYTLGIVLCSPYCFLLHPLACSAIVQTLDGRVFDLVRRVGHRHKYIRLWRSLRMVLRTCHVPWRRQACARDGGRAEGARQVHSHGPAGVWEQFWCHQGGRRNCKHCI